MMKFRLQVDFNDMDTPSTVLLNQKCLQENLSIYNLEPCAGVFMTFFEKDENEEGVPSYLEIDGVLRLDAQTKEFFGELDWDSLRWTPIKNASESESEE